MLRFQSANAVTRIELAQKFILVMFGAFALGLLEPVPAKGEPAPAASPKSNILDCQSALKARLLYYTMIPTPQEVFVWDEVCRSRTANLINKYPGPSEIRDGSVWPQERTIRAKFLEIVLIDGQLSKHIPIFGFKLSGAIFDGKITLRNAELKREVYIDKSVLNKSVDISNLKSSHSITFDGSGGENIRFLAVDLSIEKDFRMKNAFVDFLDINGSEIKGNLILEHAEIARVHATSLRVDKHVRIDGGIYTDIVRFDQSRIGQSFVSNGIQAKDIDLTGAKIVGNLDFSTSKILGNLCATQLDVGQNIFLRSGVIVFADFTRSTVGMNIDANAATIGLEHTTEESGIGECPGVIDSEPRFKLFGVTVKGALELSNATMHVPFKAEGMYIGDDLLLDGLEAKNISVTYSEIGKNLNMKRLEGHKIDLSGTDIGNEFLLTQNSDSLTFTAEAGNVFSVIDTKANVLRSSLREWPAENGVYRISGLTLHRIEVEKNGSENSSDEIRLIKNWLDRSKTEGRLPYTHIANILRVGGEISHARTIEFAGEQRVMRDAWNNGSYSASISRFVQLMLIGHGIYLWVSIVWVVLFTVAGVVVVGESTEAASYFTKIDCKVTKFSLFDKILFSIDRLLPIFTIRKINHDIDFTEEQSIRYYFYAHSLFGYLLGFVLAAWLSGIGKG